MADKYENLGAACSPAQGTCFSEFELRERLHIPSRATQRRRAVSISSQVANPVPSGRLPESTAENAEASGQPHPALIALTRLLARQVAAELTKTSNTGLEVDEK
jgi:hypothetical protein